MADNLYFKSLSLTNFRLFRSLEIPKFNRINLFGGFNGAGKSALLETLFCLADINHPLTLVKPYNFRATNIVGREGLDLLFLDQDTSASIAYDSPKGRQIVKIEKSKLPDKAISAISANAIGSPIVNSSSLMGNHGIRIAAGKGSGLFESYILPTGDGYTGTITKLGDNAPPPCQLLSTTIRVSPVELASWLSECIKSDKLPQVVDYLRILDPSISDLTILYSGQNPTIYAKRSLGIIAVDLLGEGFRNLFATILTILRLDGGIVLMDEIDTALHYSITSKFWSIIAKAASETNCQIFATSHSREAILSAAKGLDSAGYRNDFAYMRIERANGEHQVVSYTLDEVELAAEYGFEFR